MFIENTEELAQNKLLLLYIVDKSVTPFTNQELTELILDKGYMNYFLIQQYLSDLVKTSFIELVEDDDKKIYRVLEKGHLTLSYFDERIDKNIKEELGLVLKTEVEVKVEKEVVSEYFKKDGAYVVNLKLKEGETSLFSLYLNLPTENQAKIICDNWETSPEKIYKNIFNTIVGEDII